MKFQAFVRLVARNSVRNRRRTALTLLSVSFVAGGGNDGKFYFHWDCLNELFPENAAQTIFLIARDSSELPAISEAVDTMFANSPSPTRPEAESAFILQLMSMWLIASNTMAIPIASAVRRHGSSG